MSNQLNQLRSKRLKRINLYIYTKNKAPDDPPEMGSALVNEITFELITFFTTRKFKIDEELLVCYEKNGIKIQDRILLSHLHEQISSGRVMSAIPTEENPFPSRKFYRCFATVLERKELAGPTPVTETESAKQASVEPIIAENIVPEAA